MADKAASASRFKFRLTRRYLAVVVGILLAAGLGWFLDTFRVGGTLVQKSYDLLHIWRGDVQVEEAAVIYMDEKSHLELNQPQNAPWDRKLHTELVDRLTVAGVKAIVFDVVFSDPDTNSDAIFAAAMKRHGKVILAADYIAAANEGKRFVRACDELLDAAAAFGSAERIPDSDLVVRRHTPGNPDNLVGILGWVTAQAVDAPITSEPGAEFEFRWLHYYGRPYVPGKPSVIRALSYYEVLSTPTDVDLALSNKVVYVGARIQTKFAGDRKDEYPSPYSSFEAHSFMAGVEIQATEYLNLVRGDWLRRLPLGLLGIEQLVIVGLGFLFGAGLVFLRPAIAAVTAGLLLGLVILGSYYAFTRHNLWFPWLVVAVQILAALSWSVLFNSVQIYVQKRLFEFTLGLYLSPKLVKKFSASPEMLKPGAEKQLLTFMFSDIADFTSISEGMDGDELAGMMNDYFQPAVGNCIHKTEGTVVKYIGDAIFALWNAPEIQLDHAERACEAALFFRDLSKQPVRGRKLHTRIGLHTGVANVGNFGSEDRVDYTAIGENVNLASRMEGLNKYLGTDCLISGETKKHISDRFVTRRVGLFQLKGFEGLVEVQELVGFKEQAESTQAWREAFREALENFEQRNIVFAELGFRRVLELKPDDGPATHYLNRIKEISAEEVQDTWATHTILKDK
jgi:adenylate cyclase